MRGRPENDGSFWYSINVEELIEPSHPLCAIKRMLDRVRQQHDVRVATLGADKGYDSGDFLLGFEQRKITAHLAIRPDPIVARDEGGRARASARARQRCKGH